MNTIRLVAPRIRVRNARYKPDRTIRIPVRTAHARQYRSETYAVIDRRPLLRLTRAEAAASN